MLACYSDASTSSVPIFVVQRTELESWLDQKGNPISSWAKQVGFQAKPGEICIVPSTNGEITAVLLGIVDPNNALQIGNLATRLPKGNYALAMDWKPEQLQLAAMAWGLAHYRFTQYKKADPYPAKLVIPSGCNAAEIQRNVQTFYFVRDLINTPPQDMNTNHLAAAANQMAEFCGAEFDQIQGVDLLTQNFPMIYAVGKGSEFEPHLLELRWGKNTDPKVTLVGKGVCFDSGGLDIKPADGMRNMKKDMAGAAHVLGLARMIIEAKLPVKLRVLIPVVENSVSGGAYHPSDVLRSRKGLTVEVANTDAEGRLILADALTEASSDNPDLIIDIATLTGAARVALGNEIGAFFTDDQSLSDSLMQHAKKNQDPLWPLPIYMPYRPLIDSPVADIANSAPPPMSGGAINAAIFLKEFVGPNIPWVHFDIMAWNTRATCIGPEGAEVNALRALYSYLKERFTPQK